MRKYGLLLAVSLLSGCGASSHLLVGAQRPPIDPSSVRVYLQPPAHFEQVAMLEASSAGSGAFTSQQKSDKVLTRLKQEAAQLGANGLLLQGIGSQSGGSVATSTGNVYGSSYGNSFSGSSYGTTIAVPIMNKAGSAIAIYVTDGSLASPAPGAPSPTLPAESCESCKSLIHH